MLAVEREKQEHLASVREQMSAFMKRAQDSIDQTVQDLTRKVETATKVGMGSGTRATERIKTSASTAVQSLEAEADEMRRELEGRAPQASGPAFEVGAAVRVKSMARARGVILEMQTAPDATARAVVQVGNFRLEKPIDDLEFVSPPARQKQHTRAGGTAYSGADGARVAPKLDLRGKRYDEAISEAEQYIDAAFRSGAAMVTVITGHGTGALKKGLKDLLKNLSYVREFRPERQGDDGATLIEFEH
jgi:DNA mismatch repair protein MutS2